MEEERGTEGQGGVRGTGRRGDRKREREWWADSEFVGLGRGVEVVDVRRVGEDWGRRVGGRR